MSLARHLEAFLSAQYSGNAAELTIKNQRSHLTRFVAWLEPLEVLDATALTREHIESYMEELAWTPTRRGQPMKPETRNVRLCSIKCLCRWLLARELVAIDPAAKVDACREGDPLPRSIVSEENMRRLLAAPDAQSVLGFRDRLVLELLYVSALRLRELCALDVDALDLGDGFVHVRRGKGDKDRVVPLGTLAIGLCESYLASVRPQLLAARGDRFAESALILSRYGERLGPAGVARTIRRYTAPLGLSEHVTPHTFRHSCATHMLRGGANLRHLQELLGHRRITSTEIYTRVTITELKEAHAKFHPRGAIDEAAVRRPKRRRT